MNMVVMLTKTVEGTKVCAHTHALYVIVHKMATSLICSARVKTTTQNHLEAPSTVAGFI